MTWSAAAQSVWGKTDRDSQSWLPLVVHLEQAAVVAGLLWDEFLPRSLKLLLMQDLEADEADARSLYCWFAGVHDVGKVSPDFAQQAADVGMNFILDRMRDQGLSGPRVPPSDHVRHEVVSQLAVRDWFESALSGRRRATNTWACVVGGHHGRNPSASKLQAAEGRPHAVGAGPWAAVRVEILEGMASRLGVRERLRTCVQRPLPVRSQVLLTAIVVLADWLASNQDLFPYLDTLTPRERGNVALAELDLPAPWSPPTPPRQADELLHRRFPALEGVTARPIQVALLGAAFSCSTAPLLIVEAPMGEGKTEAALMAAEVLAARFGQGGVYVGLPTMATANPMFRRALAWLGTAVGSMDASIALAHGKAGLNDDYTGLLRGDFHGHIFDEEAGQPVVNSWLRGRRRAGLADFVVGTIDQGLFTALKAKYVVLRHVGLATKVVVIDEVHAADTYMREYLKRALSWLGAYGTPVILMSATLPPAQRAEYLAAYAGGAGDREPAAVDDSDVYPRITCYDGAVQHVPVRPNPVGRALSLRRIADETAVVADLLGGLLSDGGCAGVICNTVARAQAMYQVLRESFGEEVVLLHSRFIAPDRAGREQRLVEALGPGTARRPHRLVVVGTQVLEQSLDVDFDVMVSDLAPADLLLQRVGRLHRHARDSRPAALAGPTLFLRGVEDWAESPPRPVRGSRAVYGEAALLRAAAVLGARDVLTLPDDIPTLVRRAYDPLLPAPEGWERAWTEAEAKDATKTARSIARARAYLLDDPRKPADLDGWIDVDAGDPERSEEQGRSQVRDSEDSLEVIALWRGVDGALRLPDCAPNNPGALIPEGLEWGTGSENRLAREMATCTLSLPAQLTNPRDIERVIQELERAVDASGWQQSPWLKGQLVLAFDQNCQCRLAGYELRYSYDEGLVVTHPEESS